MFSAIYWFQPNPGPLTANAWLFYAFCVVVFVTSLAWSGWRLTYPRSRGLPYFEWGVGLVGLALVGARLAQWPGWSARIWPLLLVMLACGGPLAAYWARRPASPLDDILNLLAFRQTGWTLPLSWRLVLWLLHWLGLVVWTCAIGAPAGWAAIVAVMLLLQWLVVKAARPAASIFPPNPAPLTPLFLAYASGGLCLLFNLANYPALRPIHPSLAEVWWLPFYLTSMTTAAALYTVGVELFWLNFLPQTSPSQRRMAVFGAYSLAMAALWWLAFELFTHHTHGVTGTDPYGYAQVAVDWMTQGTLWHRFDLFARIADLNIAWAPVVAQGYHLPFNGAGDAASVWPPGMAMLLAAGYGLWGEMGLYLTGPLLALLAAPLAARLAAEMAVKPHGLHGFMAGSLALFIWVTSIEVVDRSLVPMADVAASLFTVGVWLSLLRLRINRRQRWRSYGWAVAAGLFLGLAFAVRYTQLLLVVSVVVGIAMLTGVSWRQKGGLLAAAGLGALTAALPDIIYRWQVFSSPLANPQARELTHFAWANILPTATTMLPQLFHGQEFGLLLPFLAAGLIWHWRRDRAGCLTLTAGALAVVAIQLPYASLRLRDLLPLFPLLAAWSGLGLAGVITVTLQFKWPAAFLPRLVNLLVITLIFLALLLPIIRAEPLVTRAWQPHRASFGYVTATERVALAQMQSLTPAAAVIGLQLNGGAITLHSHRRPFYPGGWSQPEFDRFLARLAAAQTPVYLLDDGPDMRPVINWLAAANRLRLAARLAVPLPADYPQGGQLYEVLTISPQ